MIYKLTEIMGLSILGIVFLIGILIIAILIKVLIYISKNSK